MTIDKLQGVPINISGKEYIIAPFSLEEFERLVPRFLTSGFNSIQAIFSTINIHVAFIHASLSKNYPEMTLDQVREILHFSNEQSLTEGIRRNPNSPGIIETLKDAGSVVQERSYQAKGQGQTSGQMSRRGINTAKRGIEKGAA